MELNPSTEQAGIRDAVASFLSKKLPFDQVRVSAIDQSKQSIDETTWRRCAELGWFALGIPEEAGGLGLGAAEEMLLCRELGRHLTPGPFIATIIAAHIAAGDLSRPVLERLLAGDERAGLSIGGLVLDAGEGELAVDLGPQVACLVRVRGVEAAECVDPTVRVGRAESSELIARVSTDLVSARASLLHAAALQGIAEAVLQDSVEYAKARVQFGHPIGSFQAVKHRCADMAIRAHAAYAQLAMSALALDARWADTVFQIHAAAILCVESARRNTADNIQNHGGIGFTDDHSAGWYLKRAQVLAHATGDSRARVARLVGAPPVIFE